MQANSDAAYSSLDTIHQKQQVTLLSDPLQFIQNQFTLPADIETHNYYAQKYNVAEGALNEITAATTAAGQAANVMQKSMSADMAQAELDKVAATSTSQAAALRMQAAGNTIKGLTDINNLTTQQADMVFKAHQAANSDQSLAMQAENNRLLQQQRLLMIQDRQDKMDSRDATQASIQSELDAYNIGAKRQGRATIDSIKLFQQIYAGQQKNPTFQNALAIGHEAMLQGGDTSGIPVAQDAGAAARDYATAGTNTSGNVVGTYLKSQWDKSLQDPAAAKNKDQFAEQVGTKVKTDTLAMSKSIDTTVPGNIYAAPPPAVVLTAPRLKDNSFINDVISPLVAVNPTATIPDGTILSSMLGYVKESTANYNLGVAGIVDYYKQAVLLNNKMNQYRENGVAPQTSYPARINGKNYDLTNPADVKRYTMDQYAGNPFAQSNN